MDNYDLFGNVVVEKNDLRKKYVIPPFSILNCAEGTWQNRKNMWINLGIKSEIGRSATTFNFKDWTDKQREKGMSGHKLPSDTSIFDPVLCEVVYKWFVPPTGKILDPFAGGSVRGIVANYLGYKYTGIDLSGDQIYANKEQANEIIPDNVPNWICGDSNEVLESVTTTLPRSKGDDLTPFQKIGVNMWVKREDYAGYRGQDYSSGTKVRAYNKMIKSQNNIDTLAIGCSADSLMQIYVAEMAQKHGLKSKIFIPQRKDRSELTKMCYEMGANINEIPAPCYPSHYRLRLKEYAQENPCVVWDSKISTEDTAHQIKNLPKEAKRIVVSCGSGAITIGIVVGLILENRLDVDVVAIKVSSAFGGLVEIKKKIEYFLHKKGLTNYTMPNITIIEPEDDYSKKCYEVLPDGTELDYSYSSKAYRWLQKNKKDYDVLWVSGRRPKLKINYQNNKQYSNDYLVDFIFSCPPYYDLEVYSDDEGDLSRMNDDEFDKIYASIIKKSCYFLKQNRFACFVVGNVRNKQGYMRDLVGLTIRSFEACGVHFYNDIILKTVNASGSLRADGNMKYRKIVKAHQNVLVFCKGDPKKIDWVI